MTKTNSFRLLFVLGALILTCLSSVNAQVNGDGSGTLLDPFIVNSFPYATDSTQTSAGGEFANGMIGACPSIPCCSVEVYKVTLPANGALRVEMSNWTPLAGSIIGYYPTTSNVTAYSDLTYISATPGNFCGFRDTMLLGRAYDSWDSAPYGQLPSRNSLTAVFDFNAPSPSVGFFPAGDYYILVFNENQQSSIGLGTTTGLTFEFGESCAPLTTPSELTFDNLEFNAASDTISFFVKNDRQLDVTIDTSSLVLTGTDLSEFSILTYPDTSLAVGDSTLISIVFAPTTGGAKTATLTIPVADTVCSTTSEINLSGLGTESDIVISGNGVNIANNDISPSSNDNTNLGAIVSNTGSISQTFTIVNNGTDTLSLNGSPIVSLVGSAAFTVTSNPSTTVLPGASTTFSISYTPTSIGLEEVEVIITNNDVDKSSYQFRVSGTGAGLNGLNFDGSSDYVNLNAVSAGMTGVTAFTIETWVKIPSSQAGNDAIVGVNTSTNGTRMLLWLDDGKLEFHVGSNDIVISSQDMRDDIWHNLVFVFDNGSFNYYLDGELTSIITNNVPAFVATDQWSIGQEYDSGGPSDFLLGSLDEFRLWTVARTQQEILDARFCEISNPSSDLLAYYTFNQGVPDGDNSSLTKLTDWSGSGLDGDLNGFALNGTTSNFIATSNVGTNCTSFNVSICDEGSYTSPSGRVISADGLIMDTIPNSSGGDSTFIIDLSIKYSESSQSNLSDASLCSGTSYSGEMSTDLVSTYNFEASNSDWVEINDVKDSLINTNRSIFLWMRAAGQINGDFQTLVGINGSGTSTISNFIITTNEQLSIYDGGSYRNSGVTVTDTNWHFVGYTYDEASNLTQFWIDGVAAASFSNGQSISATNRISLGQEFDGTSTGNFFDGEMTEVSFWNEVLDSTDIAGIFHAAITDTHSKYNNLVGYYPGNGSCGDDAFAIRDFGPHAYDGMASATSILNVDSLVALPAFDATAHYDLNVRLNGSVVATGNPFTIGSATGGTHIAALERDFFAIVDSFDLSLLAQPSASILEGNTTSLVLGDSVQLTTSVQNGVSYEWFRGFDDDWRLLGPEGFSPGAVNYTRVQVGPDGTIYTAFRDDANGNGATVMSYNGRSWEFVGNAGFSAGAINEIDFKIAEDSTLYVAFEDNSVNSASGSGGATVMFYDGTAWQTLGTTEFSAGGILDISLEISPSDTIFVGYRDLANSNRGTVQKFNGTAWEVVGTAGFTPSVAVASDLGIAPDGTLYYAYGDFTKGSALTVKMFDGTNWQTIGTQGFSAPSASRTNTLDFGSDGEIYVGTLTGTGTPFAMGVYQFDGTDWELLDTTLLQNSNPVHNAVAIAPNGSIYTQTVSGATPSTATVFGSVFQLNGSSWQTVGNANFTSAQTTESSVAFGLDGNPIYIARDAQLLNGTSFRASAWRFGPEFIGQGTSVFVSDTGNYVLVAANANGCIARDTIFVDTSTVTVPMVIATINIDSNISCNGFSNGGATVSATGGAMPYTYAWSNSATTASITGVAAGTYTVTVTDNNGLTAMNSGTITQPAVLVSATVVDANASCNGFSDGGATASATGGTQPYTYAWSNSATTAGITGVVAGTYSVTITDQNGCTDSTSTTITEPVALVATATLDNNATNVAGNNGSVTASAAGGTTAYTFAWSNGATTATTNSLSAGTYSVTITDQNGCTDSASVAVVAGPGVSVTIDSNISCNNFSDGGATAVAVGGTSPYTYAWSNSATTVSITGVTAGTYTVTVTDNNGLTATNSGTITQPAVLVAATVVDANASCNGFSDGGATASATGGTQPYTYAWSNSATTAGITGVVAGTYSVTITDQNGCTDSTSTTITEPVALVATATLDNNATNVAGNNGSVTASATGGTTAYTFAWSNGATTATTNSLSAGTYSVTITDQNGCTDSASVAVVAGPGVSVTIDSTVSCNSFTDGGATASVSGGTSPYTYAWSNSATTVSITGVTAGTYTITVTDNNGLTATNSGTITEPAVLVAAMVVDSNASCNGFSDGGATASATGGTTPYTYAWNNSATTAGITGVTAGTYSVTITDSKGCTSTTNSTITEPTVLAAAIALDSNDIGNGGGATASATGGTTTYTYAWSNGATTASITGLAVGTYTVTTTDNNGCTDSDNIMISANPVPAMVIDSNVSCNGFSDGGATVSAVGGTMPYTYSWNNTATTASITGVAAGTYTITVTDANGLTGTAMGTVTQPTALIAAIVVDSNVTCKSDLNGGATASATGGTMPYTYAWNNAATTASITGVAAGTYTVTITDNNGCTSTSSTMITEPDSVVFTVLETFPASCNGASDGGFSYVITGGTPTITGPDTSYVVLLGDENSVANRDTIPTGAGLFEFLVRDANNCISDTIRITITEPTLLVAATVIDSNVSCNSFTDGGATVSATGGTNPYTYAWSNTATTTSITGVAAGTYTVTITDGNGCTSTSSSTVTEPAVLVAATAVDSTISCNSFSDGGATASATGGTTPYTYAWSNSATTASITGVVAGTYSVTITDANGCTSTSNSTITEPAVLVAATAVDSNVTCNTFTDGGATASATGGTAPYTYVWNNAATTAGITGVAAGTYTVTITDVNGCTNTSSSTITEPAVLVASTVVDSNATCLGFTDGGATASAVGGTTPYTYAWNNAATTASITGVANGTYTVTITDANACTSTSTTTIIVVDTVKPNVITQNVTIYLDASGVASITTADIDNGTSDACGVSTLALDSTNFDCSEVGANTVQLIATDVNNNVDSASAVVTVLDTLNPLVATQNITVYLDANGAASITTADINNGSSDNCAIQAMSLDSTNFDCSEVGTNTVTLTATDVNNNVDSATAVVTVLDTLRPIVTTQNITVYLDANGAASITTADINNGSSDNCAIQAMSLDSTNFDCSEVGANTVYLRVTDVNNNIDSASATVTVLDTLNPLISGCPANITQVIDAGSCTAVVTWTAPTAADNCTVDSLIASHNPGDVFALGTTTVTYIAYDPELNTDTCTFTVTITDSEDPVIANMPSNITVNNDLGNCGAVVTWTSATASDNCTLDSLRSDFQSGANFPVGITTVTYTAYDAAMNTSTASFTVTVVDNELPIITCPANMAQCDSIVSFIDATATDNCGIASIVRLDNTGLNSGDEFPIGITTISYLVTDVNNNEDSCSFEIEVYAPPVANAGEDLVTRDIQPIVIEASSTNGVSFRWTPAFSVAIDTAEQPIVNPQETTTYTMEVTTAEGCIVTDEVTVTVNVVTKLDATTLFSPNGDGMNDTWVVNKPALVENCQLIIFNRNGTEVYSTMNYNNDWEGTVRGENLPEGTYYFVFDCSDGRTYNGPITILRERR